MKIGFKLIILFLIIAILPIIVLSIIHYQNAENQIIEQTFQRLDTTALLVESEISLEIEKQFLTMDLFASRVLLRTSLENFNEHELEKDRENMHKIIDSAFESNVNLASISILNTDHKIVASTDKAYLNEQLSEIKLRSLNDNYKEIDFELHTIKNKNIMHVKLYTSLLNDEQKHIGFAILEFNAGDVFLANQNIGLGDTGEYVLAKRNDNGDALFITPLRFEENAMLSKIILKDRLDVPMTQALLKNEKTFEDKVDYRNKPVYAITKYIEDTDWGLVVKIDQEEAVLPIQNLKNLTYYTIIISSIMSVLAAIVFSKSISDSIDKVRKATKDIASGNFTTKLISSGSDEIQELSKDINIMANELEHQKDSLKKSERLSSIGELSSRLAHDLKNPLSVMKMSIDLIKKNSENTKVSDPVVATRIGLIDKSIERISHQVDDILGYVRNSPLKLINTSVRNLILNSIQKINIPNDVELNISNKDVQIDCDSIKLDAVFINLIVNSIQAMQKGGKIEIKIDEEDNMVILQFIDSGEEIPDGNLEKVFEPLFTTKQKGTGLGLAICKNIVEQHKGEIYVKNNPTTFTIKLPKTLLPSIETLENK